MLYLALGAFRTRDIHTAQPRYISRWELKERGIFINLCDISFAMPFISRARRFKNEGYSQIHVTSRARSIHNEGYS